MDNTVLGVFPNREDAQEAIRKLEDFGYNPRDVSIVMKNRQEANELASDTGAKVTGGAASGAVTGGVIGALAGLLVGTGVFPGLGVLLVGGPLAAALGLTGAAATTVSGAATGVVAGGLVGALAGVGVSRDDAKSYERSVNEGGILVLVPTHQGDEAEVRNLLAESGADQIKLVRSEEDRTSRFTRRGAWERDYGRDYFPQAGAKGGRRSAHEEGVAEDEEEIVIERVVKPKRRSR